MSKAAKISSALLSFLFVFIGAGLIVQAKPGVKKDLFGKTAAGKSVEIYTLKNSQGAEAKIITYGGTVVSLKVPDKNGKFDDIVLGYDSVADYEKNAFYMGALVGRYANRIAKGKFSLGGRDYNLAINNGDNHLHGGLKGFDKVVWTAKARRTKTAPISNLLV